MKGDTYFKHVLKNKFDIHPETLVIIEKHFKTGEYIKCIGLQNNSINSYLDTIRRSIKNYRECEIFIFKNHFKIVIGDYQKRFLNIHNNTFNFLLK